MKKICISTYCEWSSYGSVMQAIGLKVALKKMGVESFVVRDTPAPVSTKKFGFVIPKKIKALIVALLEINIRKKKERRYSNCVKFINDNVDIIYYNDFESLNKQAPKADYYIAGSDQIWHPVLCKQAFFLDFLPESVKRYSYAASMGVLDVQKNKENLFKRLIGEFSSCSVREEQMVSVIKKYVDTEIKVHIDPTFLLTGKEWEYYEREYNLNGDYILVYAIYWDKKFNKELKRLHRRTGIKIVALCTDLSSVWANEKIYDADCGNFLWLIRNAQAVITSSFHGLAFALNYNKKVSAVINPASPTRLNNLLNILCVENLPIEQVMSFDLSKYEAINSRIEQERKKGIAYLKGILVNE